MTELGIINMKMQKYTKIFKFKNYYRSEKAIWFVDQKNQLNIILEKNRKTKFIKNVKLLKNGDRITNVKEFKFFVYVNINDQDDYNFQIKNLKNKEKNKSLEFFNLKDDEKITNLFEFNTKICAQINNFNYSIYDYKVQKIIELSEDKENFVTYIDVLKNYVRIQFNYCDNKIFTLKDFQPYKTEYLKNDDHIKGFTEYKTYIKIEINDDAEHIILNKINGQKLVLKDLKEDERITKFDELNTFVKVEINDDLVFLYTLHELERVYFPDIDGENYLTHVEEYDTILKVVVSYIEFYIYDKQKIERIPIKNEKIKQDEKISFYEEFKNFIKIKVGEKEDLIFLDKINFKEIKLNGLDKNDKLTNIFDSNNFIVLELNKKEYVFYDIKKNKKLILKGIKVGQKITDYELFDDFFKIQLDNKGDYLYFDLKNLQRLRLLYLK